MFFLQTNGSGVLSFAGVSASAGQVIQVVSATDSTSRSTSSASFVTASNTLSVSITPSSASNKIVIFVSHYASVSANAVFYTIYRGATNLGGTNGFAQMTEPTYSGSVAYLYIDSPSTTSATTYQSYLKANLGTGYMGDSNSKAQIIAMEIKG